MKSSRVTSSGSLYMSFGLLNRRCSRLRRKIMIPSASSKGAATPAATPASALAGNPSSQSPPDAVVVSNDESTSCAICAGLRIKPRLLGKVKVFESVWQSVLFMPHAKVLLCPPLLPQGVIASSLDLSTVVCC